MPLRFSPARGASVLISASSRGPVGAAATATAGTTTTANAGTSASVANSGSTAAAVFDFTIPRGADAGIKWLYDSSTSMADPGAGEIRFNNATLSSVTAIAVSATGSGSDVSDFVATFDDSTNPTKAYIVIREEAGAVAAVFSVSAVTDNTDWLQLTVAYVSGSLSLTASDPLYIVLLRSGDIGTSGTRWNFDSSTSMADPGSGDIRLNHATLASVTAIAVSDNSAESGAPDTSAFVLSWDDVSNSTARGILLLKKRGAAQNFAAYRITGASTDNSGWTQLAVTHLASAGSFTNADPLVVEFASSGTDGAGTFPGTSVDNEVPRFDGTGGATFQQSGIVIDDSKNIQPETSDVGALGTTTKMFADLFLASGGVINFNNGNMTITHAAGVLTFSGGVTKHPNTGFGIFDTNASHVLKVVPGSDISADRTLTVTTGDADRTLTISASATVSQDYSSTGNPQFATIELGHASANTLSASGGVLSVEGVAQLSTATGRGQGKETIYIPAAAMVSRTTNGAATGSVELATNKIMVKSLDFDTTTQEFAQFSVAFPKSWNLGTVTFQPHFSQLTTAAGGVVFGLAGVAVSSGDALDAALGTAQTSTLTAGTANLEYIGPESSAITIAGTPAAGDRVIFQVNRTVADGSDTLAQDARLHGIRLFFTTNAATDA